MSPGWGSGPTLGAPAPLNPPAAAAAETPIGAAAAAAAGVDEHPAAPDAGEQPAADTDWAPPRYPPNRTPGGLAPIPARDISLGVPASALYSEPSTRIVDVPAGFAAEDVARAWVQHLKLVAGDFRGVLSVLPHGDVSKVLAEAGPLVTAIAAGL